MACDLQNARFFSILFHSCLPCSRWAPPSLFRLLSPSKVAACVLFIFSPASRPFSLHRSSNQRSVSLEFFPLAFFPWPPASRACTRPFFCRISSVPPFVAALRGAGVARRGATFTQMEKEKRRTGRNYGERKVVRLMKSQFSVLPFADSTVSLIGLGKGPWGKNACVGPEGRRSGIYTRCVETRR